MTQEFPIGLGEERAIVNGNKSTSYLDGGAGYVLSKGTLRIYGNVTYHNNSLCPMDHQGEEDVTLGKCLTDSGVLLGDSRDELGRHRFLQEPPVYYIRGTWQKWYPKYDDLPLWQGNRQHIRNGSIFPRHER
ncbi:glycoprotein-N-acetylgalactosamine 3-beta-galactosyltransferase 1-like [Macrobrachium nipponense]|uniref:glycoprotein-N-acetylgalactosamine 3-beta-galactosyltransferase 1-like n=1 Tax=Macrobrachium nipponense TaxID=159736 RepID=UPI0030C823E0